MESPPSGAGLSSSGPWENPGAEGSACLVSSLCTRRHLVLCQSLLWILSGVSKYLEQRSPPTGFSKGQPLLCPQAHSPSTGLTGATRAAMWPFSPSSAFWTPPAQSSVLLFLIPSSFSSTFQRNPSFQRLTVSLSKWDVKKFVMCHWKNQISPGNNNERFVFLNQRHSREFLPLVLVFYRRPLGNSSVSAWFDLCAGGTFANVTSGSRSRRRTKVRTIL